MARASGWVESRSSEKASWATSVFPAGREALHGFHAQFAGGERAGLVERDGVDGRQFLDRRAAAEQNAVAGAPGDRRQHGGRNREHQRARRGHHQQRHGVIKRAVPDVLRRERRLAEAQPPDEEHDERQPQHAVGVIGAEPVGELLRRRFLLLGVLDEMDDLLQRTLRPPAAARALRPRPRG